MLLGKWIFVKFLLSKRRKKDEKYGFVADVFQLSKLAEISSPQSKAMACSLIESFVAFFFFFSWRTFKISWIWKLPHFFRSLPPFLFAASNFSLHKKQKGQDSLVVHGTQIPRRLTCRPEIVPAPRWLIPSTKQKLNPLLIRSFIHSLFLSSCLSFFPSFFFSFFHSLSQSLSLWHRRLTGCAAAARRGRICHCLTLSLSLSLFLSLSHKHTHTHTHTARQSTGKSA